MFKKLLSVLLALVIVLSMCACSSVSEITGDKEDEAVYEKSNTVNLAMNNVKTLNPVISQDEDTYQISRLIYQSLFVLDETLMPVGDLASSYKVSKDKTAVTITLDSKARFSDGEKVTSEDVAFSIEAYQKAGSKSAYYGNVKNIDSVKKDGSSKIRIKFKKYGGGIQKLTFPILPSHKNDISSLLKANSSFKPLGSGQYKVKKYVKDESLVLNANSKYSGDKAENTLSFTVYPDKADVLNLMSGNIVSFLVRTDADRHSDIGCTDLRNDEFSSNRLVFAGFNTKKSSLSQSKVRKAICYAIDREALLKKEYYSSGVIADSMFYPGYLGINSEDKKISYSIKTSKELLEKAGWKDINKDGYLENANKKKVELKIAVSKSREKTAKYIASELDKVELSCKVVSYSKKDFRKALKKGNFDIYIGEMTFADYYDLTDIIGGSNDYVSCSSELIKLARNTNRCLDEESIRECSEKLMNQLDNDIVYFPVIYITYSYILSDELEGEAAPMFNNIYRGCSSWSSSYLIENDDSEEKEK